MISKLTRKESEYRKRYNTSSRNNGLRYLNIEIVATY